MRLERAEGEQGEDPSLQGRNSNDILNSVFICLMAVRRNQSSDSRHYWKTMAVEGLFS